MPIVTDIVERHASEAAFSWTRRDVAVRAGHHDLDSIADLDETIEAHLDGLRVAGDAAWDICRGEVEGGDGGALFVATVLATGRADLEGLAMVLDAGGGSPLLSRGIASGLGWAPRGQVEAMLPGFLAEGGPDPLQWLGIAACAAHRMDPGPPLAWALESADVRLAARAARAAGELGRADFLLRLRELLSSDQEGIRFAAAWSLALLGDRQGVPALLGFASAQGPFAEKAALLALRAADARTQREWIEACSAAPRTQRTAVLGAGAAGDPALVPWLLQAMQTPALARVAGASFSLITGVDLRKERLFGDPPEGASFGPNDDPDDENVALDPDEHLVWPAPGKVAERWHRIQRSLPAGQRHLLGQVVGHPGWLHRVLASGSQTERAAAALEIALHAPGHPLFEVRAPGFQQRETLGAAA
ncbi:MAG: TIGR02270 family protein [Byssovorax sp.]